MTYAIIFHDLDVALGGRTELLAAMKAKTVAKAAYVGRYRSPPPSPSATQ